MTEIAGAVEPGEMRTPMLFGRFRTWLAMVAFVTILAGVLFGYDQGVIAGALGGMTASFDLSTTMQEVVTSLVTLGALVGALLGGGLADRFGRTRTLVIAGVLFAFGALGESVAQSTGVLTVSRFVVGFGVGIASVAGPLYAAEMAPKQVRGRFVSSYQLAITIGILLADIVDAALSDDDRWRLMLGLSIVPGVVLIAVAAIMPDSPRWLMKMGRRADARKSLVKTQGGPKVEERLDVIADDLTSNPEAGWSKVFVPALRRALWVGVGLAVFQQVTGINAVIYYSDKIFALGGLHHARAADACDAHRGRAGERPGDADRGRVGRPLRSQAAAVRRSHRDDGRPGGHRGCFRLPRQEPDRRWRFERRRDRHPHRDGGLHRVVRVLPRSGGLDDDLGDLPEPGARQGGCSLRRGQLGSRVHRQRRRSSR